MARRSRVTRTDLTAAPAQPLVQNEQASLLSSEERDDGGPTRSCLHCGMESITDCCVNCERILYGDSLRGADAVGPELKSQVEFSSREPLGTSTRDSTRDGESTWDGDVLAGDSLASWDDHPALLRFVDEIAGESNLGMPPGYRYA